MGNVTTTITVLAPVRRDRWEIILQNTGKETVYIKKILPGMPDVAPTPTNFDHELGGAEGEGHDGDILKLRSIARFLAVTSKGSSSVAVMETVVV